jgi:translation initiation factor 1
MSSHSPSSSTKRIAYQEFGQSSADAAFERALPDLSPQKQDLRIQSSRSGRKGKTVTTISGFQQSTESLEKLLKQLKTQCGSGGTLKNQTMEIQGDHRPKLLEMLTQLGYKAKISGG